jgi:hypothetical protein
MYHLACPKLFLNIKKGFILRTYIHLHICKTRQFIMLNSKSSSVQTVVAHTCHPIYSGGKDQEDHDLRTAQANSS